jgi:hypothetical protein
MIMVRINKTGVRHTHIDNGSSFNVCSMDLLDKLSVDKNLIEHNDLCICGFDNIIRQPLGTITLPIKVGSVVFPTPIHIMLGPLLYNFLLDRSWIHAMKRVNLLFTMR